MPFIAYVHAGEPDPRPEGRPPWEPNWRMWRWIVVAVVAMYCVSRTDGVAGLVLVIVAFAAACLAFDAALPQGDGLREWRQ
jgi:UDP-N-acetylmuramyl pentapeptide phosphotransferase/UDP-N-acetylglucosamine-1-phosphate transferase